MDVSAPVAPKMDPRFVSVGVEMWEWLFDPSALDNPTLKGAVSAMSPVVIRVGGISADQTHFTTSPFPPGLPWPPAIGKFNLLNTSTFDRLVAFCRQTGASLIFNVNEMLGRPPFAEKIFDRDGLAVPPLNLSGVEALLRHAANTSALSPAGPLFAIELGNELTPRILDVQTQAQDYLQMRTLLDTLFPPTTASLDGGNVSAPKLFGPATCSCSNMSEFLRQTSAARLDAFTFHSYPLGGAGPGLPTALRDPDRLRRDIPGGTACYRSAVQQANSSVALFMSETNSDASTFANAGQASFLNGFWYMASLGHAARAAMPLHVRWKLWNPRVSYRPGALQQTFGFLDKELQRAVPDLWVALLHKQLVGDGAPLSAGTNATGVLCWAHQSPRGVNHAASGVSGPREVILMLLNPQGFPVNVTVQANGTEATQLPWDCRREYIFTRGEGGDNSTTACLNRDEGCSDPLALGPNGTAPPMGARTSPAAAPLRMPPVSYGFVVLGSCG